MEGSYRRTMLVIFITFAVMVVLGLIIFETVYIFHQQGHISDFEDQTESLEAEIDEAEKELAGVKNKAEGNYDLLRTIYSEIMSNGRLSNETIILIKSKDIGDFFE